MFFLRYGNNLSKASQVLGDFSLSQRARNSYGPAVIFTSLKRSRSFLYGAFGSRRSIRAPCRFDEPSDRLGDDLALAEDRDPAHHRADDLPVQGSADERAHLVTIQEILLPQSRDCAEIH